MSPTRRRSELVARREFVGHTHESLAHQIEASVSAVSLWERGLRTPRGRLRRELANALGVNLAELDLLLDPTSPPELSGHTVPGWLTHYESLVHAASALRHVEKSHIPGLLQTRRYATIIEGSNHRPATEEEALRRVEIRLERQSALTRTKDPLQVTALIAETALHDQPGGPEVMAEQLDHLDHLSRRPNIQIRLIPADGCAAATPGGFELLSKFGETSPFLAVTFSLAGPHYFELPEVVTIFAANFDYLSRLSLSPADSRRLIQSINKEHYL